MCKSNSVQVIIAGVIIGHVAAKSLYVRIFAGTDRMGKNDWVAVGSWITITFGLWIIAWIIAEAIPVFSTLLSLIVCTVFISISLLEARTNTDRLPSSLVGLPLGFPACSGCT